MHEDQLIYIVNCLKNTIKDAEKFIKGTEVKEDKKKSRN